jgi:putative tryptophan/tyrosine transport system substrate-binding protein
MLIREFITSLGSAAAGPVHRQRATVECNATHCHAGKRGNADDQGLKSALAAFQQGLQQLGWADGQNLRIDFRAGAGDAENIRRHSAELAALAPDVIVALGSSIRVSGD